MKARLMKSKSSKEYTILAFVYNELQKQTVCILADNIGIITQQPIDKILLVSPSHLKPEFK